MQKCCTVLSILHLVALSIATLVASFVVESILWTGIFCMLVALVAFVCSLIASRYWLTAISLCTLAVGAFFIVFELILFMFGGPEKAALPLCLLFLVVQGLAIFATVSDLRSRPQNEPRRIQQISLRELIIATALFAISFGVMENFPTHLVPHISDWSVAFKHTWLVSLCLAMFLLTLFGLLSFWRSARSLTDTKHVTEQHGA